MDAIQTYFSNFINNLHGSFARLKPEGWIRLVWIVGAYLLLRPYLVKLGARRQQKQHEASQADDDTGAELHPNDLRGGKKAATMATPGDKSTSGAKAGKQLSVATGKKTTMPKAGNHGGDTEAKAGEWGNNARARQRKVMRAMSEKQEQRLQAEQEEELGDIQDLLE